MYWTIDTKSWLLGMKTPCKHETKYIMNSGRGSSWHWLTARNLCCPETVAILVFMMSQSSQECKLVVSI